MDLDVSYTFLRYRMEKKGLSSRAATFKATLDVYQDLKVYYLLLKSPFIIFPLHFLNAVVLVQ